MSSCSSCTSASQQVIQQLLQKATKPQTDLPDPSKADTSKNQAPSATDALNTSGDRGTTLNISA